MCPRNTAGRSPSGTTRVRRGWSPSPAACGSSSAARPSPTAPGRCGCWRPRAAHDLRPARGRREDLLTDTEGHHTVCEWKGRAHYLHAEAGGSRAEHAAWHYPDPKHGFEQLSDHLAFYAGRVDACYLDDELVTPQGGSFYGGWVTAEIEGAYKGEPGTEGW